MSTRTRKPKAPKPVKAWAIVGKDKKIVCAVPKYKDLAWRMAAGQMWSTPYDLEDSGYRAVRVTISPCKP